MSKKLILTEQQHEVIINEILKETVEKIEALEAEGRLDEGFWDTIKYALSKLGRYKAGGKIFGKGSVFIARLHLVFGTLTNHASICHIPET